MTDEQKTRIRAWLYRVALPVESLAIFYGIVNEAEGALWLGLVSALLTNGTAAYNTSTKK